MLVNIFIPLSDYVNGGLYGGPIMQKVHAIAKKHGATFEGAGADYDNGTYGMEFTISNAKNFIAELKEELKSDKVTIL